MSITKEKKQEIMKDLGRTEGDTGSPEVQCGILSERIRNLTPYVRSNKKDHAARRSLLVLVSRRRRLLKYLNGKDAERYKVLIEKLGIRK
jgi:small subunit ribosomal protein S15